ncbi:MAG: N-acetyltransferase family protein [Caulobacteraceae bacterium]
MIVRPAGEADIAAVTAIYGHHVLHGLGTFEEVPPEAPEMAARIAGVTACGLPYLVAEGDGGIVGFACATPFRPRPAYRHTVEDSVYVAPGAARTGVGRALLARVIAACEARGLRQMIAVIGDSANVASIGLHAALGFDRVGLLTAVGFKHGRWVDTVWMQRNLRS